MNLQDNATGFQHIGFPTNDLQETIAFYEKLGFSVALRTYNEEAGEAVAFLQLGNLMLEVYENHQASMQAGAWDHLAIDVKDIEAAYEEICALGLNNQKDIIHFLPFWEHGVKFFKVLQDYRAELRSNRI